MLEKLIYNQRIRTSILFGFILFIIVPTLLVGIFSFVQSIQVIERSVFQTLEYLSTSQENTINTWVKDRKTFIEGLAQDNQLTDPEAQDVANLLLTALKMDSNFLTLVLVDKDGVIKVDPTNQAMGREVEASVIDREYFQQALIGHTYVSEVLLSRSNNEPVMFFATPIRKNEEIVGVLFGVVHIEAITQLVQHNYPGDYGESYLVSETGLMLSQSKFTEQPTAFRLQMKEVPIEVIVKGGAGKSIYQNYLDKRVFGVYRWLPEIQMGLVVEKEYTRALLEYGLTTYIKVAISSILIISLFILYAMYYSRRLSQPIELLVDEVNHIAEGSYRSIIDLPANRELKELARAINHLSNSQLENKNQLNSLIQRLEQDAESLYEEKNKLARISITDELTGLHNRRYLRQELHRLTHLSKSLQKNISVLSLDLDRFKVVNDTYGHDTGDIVLKEFANLLRSSQRGTDVVGRFGGEEFIVIIPFVGGRQVKEIAERIRQAVSDFTFDANHNNIHVTVSIGVVTLIPSPDEPTQKVVEQLLKEADKGLYQAKNSGRNKVIHIDLTNGN